MSSKDSVCESTTSTIKMIFNDVNNSWEESPIDDWSSTHSHLPVTNIKRFQFDQGVYDPGSGEICTKYVTVSASSVLRHPYYKYPGIIDPGIDDALLLPEPKVKYSDDGQELYITLCREANLCAIKIFYRQLLEDNIDLSYYGIHPMAFRVIALSLKYNRFVTVLNLTDNWISLDGCFHLGEMLIENITLKELNLYGCKIGPEGARRLCVNLHLSRTLNKLNLTNNQLKDAGVAFLAKAIFLGTNVVELILTKNDLGTNAVVALCEAFETNNKVTHLDLSWNNIFSPNTIYTLCQRLSQNNMIQELNLSWNSLASPRIGNGLKILLSNPKIKCLNLSNNKLSTPVVKFIKDNLGKAFGLVTLDLSYNPLTPRDALVLLHCLKERKVKLQNLLLDNVVVTEQFIEERNIILAYGFRKKTIVTHGYVKKKFAPKGVDMRELILNRIESLCKKSKKKRIDFALIAQEIFEISKGPLDIRQFSQEIKSRGAILDEDLLGELYNLFSGPIIEKSKSIDLAALLEYLQCKWPDRKLPSTPLPVVELPNKN